MNNEIDFIIEKLNESYLNIQKILNSTNGNIMNKPNKPEISSLIKELKHLSDRWKETEQWHNPQFLSGKIEVTTRDLKNISDLIVLLEKNE